MGKDGKKGFSIWKLLFTLVFLLLSILWIVYTVFYFGWWSSGWDFVKSWPIISSVDQYLSSYNAATAGVKRIGIQMLLISVAVLLVYGTIFFPIKKIPILGGLLKTMTAIIPSAATIVFVIACIFIWGNVDLNIKGLSNIIPY